MNNFHVPFCVLLHGCSDFFPWNNDRMTADIHITDTKYQRLYEDVTV